MRRLRDPTEARALKPVAVAQRVDRAERVVHVRREDEQLRVQGARVVHALAPWAVAALSKSGTLSITIL